jgi:hypothetical protein
MGLKVRGKKKSFTFLSLKLQKCIMIIFLEKLFGFMDILHINKQKNKTIITQKINLRKKTT